MKLMGSFVVVLSRSVITNCAGVGSATESWIAQCEASALTCTSPITLVHAPPLPRPTKLVVGVASSGAPPTKDATVPPKMTF